MRNIKRVVIWGVPPSFCALVQRVGRAVRDLTQLGEAIVFIPAAILKQGSISEVDIDIALLNAARNAEAQNEEEEAIEEDLGGGKEEIDVEEGGMRKETGDDADVDEPSDLKQKRRYKSSKECNSHEARYLTLFLCGKHCRREIWDIFFQNKNKRT